MPCDPPKAGVSFNEPSLDASPCSFAIVFPFPKFNLAIPPISFPFDFLPSFKPHLKISCDLDKPVDVSAGLAAGGGRPVCYETSPDDEEG